MNSPAITVDVWSDIACPWCFIGKRKLEAGIAAFAAQPGTPAVEIEFHSYELAPDTPVDFQGDEVSFLCDHKGMNETQVRQMLTQVAGIAGDVGLRYDFEALQHANTVLAHQLVHYAQAHGSQLEAKERLFAAYFEEGRNVGRIEDLADLAADIGLDRADVVRSLTENEFLPAVRADQRQAQDYGIHGVPFYVVDGRYGISGAQDPAVFVDVFARVAAEREASIT
ncbi:MAG: DsbA family oxidoreductase [Cryobacterium sp.]